MSSAVKDCRVSLHGDSRSDRGMTGDSLNPTPPIPPAESGSPTTSVTTSPEMMARAESRLPNLIPQVFPHPERPLWVTWFAHPFANWFWFYFGFVAALSGSNMGYPTLGPVVMFGWLFGHLVNARHPWGELKLFVASLMLGYIGDGLITWLGVLKFRETTPWTWMIPFWMAMMWPNFAATLNSSMKWLRGRYRLGAILGAISGPFSYYGGVKWGAVEFGCDLWTAMTLIGIEWLLAMPLLLWLSSRWVPPDS
jgi:hypothetical protein